ncbi:MAG: NAD(P)-dependent oxidoreductase [Alphaproteobacteria bacterium]|nr:MAG: NAD(P)-dependent oxidoreductase [Alphaproteobacteria bacterium]
MLGAIGFLGFGEAAQTFAGDARWRGPAQGYDRQTDSPALAEAKSAEFALLGVRKCSSSREAVADAGIILSLVTADQAGVAARDAALHIVEGALYLDMNSVAPATKKAAAAAIGARGGLYVDAAIMSPVKPAALDAPILLSGPAAEAAETVLCSLGFTSVRSVGAEVGRASLIKMVRSVLIKGIEAVTAECLLAAHAGGVVDEVLASLGESWRKQADYNLERVLVHGVRRAAEMEEVAHTLRDLGVKPRMTEGAVAWQSEIGALGLNPAPVALHDKLHSVAVVQTAAVA